MIEFHATPISRGPRHLTRSVALALGLAGVVGAAPLLAQQGPPAGAPARGQVAAAPDYNKRLTQLRERLAGEPPSVTSLDSQIGCEDLLEITVFEAPELNRIVRVSASGEISLPLLGTVKAAGRTHTELESLLQDLLRKTLLKDPHVSVFTRELQSHPVSVLGAVKKPGVYQIREAKTVLEVLSMAEGLADDAGDVVLILRGAAAAARVADTPSVQPQALDDSRFSGRNGTSPRAENGVASEPADSGEVATIRLKDLLEAADLRANLPVFPGDIVKVPRAGIVYVVGEVKKPGGFVLKSNENISVLQALALAEGLTRTAAKSKARVIRTDPNTNQRTEIDVNLEQVLAGKAPDALLQPRDIVFVPNSAGRGAFYKGAEAVLSTLTGVVIYRR